MQLLTDRQRQPDADNPEGYFELEVVKKLGDDASWLADGEGKAVKIISQLLFDLPAEHQYRVIFMERHIEEVLASQMQMLKRLGTGDTTNAADEALRGVFEKHLHGVSEWLCQQGNINLLYIPFSAVHADPAAHAHRVCEFLGGGLDVTRMAAAVDARLYRQRLPEP